MASSYRLALVSNIGQLNTAIENAIADGEMPLGRPEFLDKYYALVVGKDANVTFDSYKVVIAPDVRTLNTQVQRALNADPDLSALGAPFSLRGNFGQVLVSGMQGGGGGGDEPTTVTSANITDATATGRSVLTASNAAAARTALDIPTSFPASAISDATATGRSVLTASNAAAARTALAIPTSFASTAISDATALGRSLMTAADAAAARTALDIAGPGAAVEDATDETDVVAQLNALLASLRSAGVISS